jgi:glycosyltransferase involved in cell wall biosynthesis
MPEPVDARWTAARGLQPRGGPPAIDRTDHDRKVFRQSHEGSVSRSHAEPKQHGQDNPRMSDDSQLALTGPDQTPASPMLRVLFVTSSFAYGGAEKQTITLMNRLASRGHECHAAYIKENHALLDRVRLRSESSVRCLAAEHYLDRPALADLAALIANLQPTVIVAANPYPLLYATIARRLARTRATMVVTQHFTKVSGPREFLQMLLYRPFFWMADCATFLCDRQKRYWWRRGVLAKHNVVIYNGVDTDKFTDTTTREHRAATRRVFGFAEADFVIGAIGDLRKEKNQIQLVAAVERLRRAGVPARALLIGDGAERTKIEARARERGVAGDIAVTGFVHDVRPFVGACDVLAVCSLDESVSIGALEAMALCKPVVHSNVGSAGETIYPGYNGFLFRANDTAALVKHLIVLTNRDDRLSIGEHARGIVERRFSEQRMIESYESLLMKLSASSNGRSRNAYARAARGIDAMEGRGRS